MELALVARLQFLSEAFVGSSKLERTKTMKCTSILQSFLLALVLVAPSIVAAQEAKVHIKVYPPEAQIFIDNKSWGKGSKTIKTTPGTHSVIVANYGFLSQRREVTLSDRHNESLAFSLERSGDSVSGPWGRIQVEDAPGQAALLLNGETPDYFVGHVDMFNNSHVWAQQLVVPPGRHHVTILDRNQEYYSGDVVVQPNQRVIIYTSNKKLGAKNWPQGATLSSLPRFSAGIASASVAVAPVTATHTVEPTRINCGESTRLAWSAKEAVDTSIFANAVSLSKVPVSGERSERPTQTTTYEFRTSGPGGVVTSNRITEVNTAVQAELGTAPAEIRYHKMGDKVIEHTPATLKWTVSNADSTAIDPIGTVDTKGEQEVKPSPKQTANGPVDEKRTYTLTAKNVCGGSETRTADVHIVGAIEPIPEVPLASVFFPTGYPEQEHPQIGLVRSQHNVVTKTAEGMKKYLIYDPEARITLTAHADVRGPARANQSLSERRANRVKATLVSQGVPEGKIEVIALGDKQNLTQAQVSKLQEANPNKSRFAKGSLQALVWAYNRRVDLTLLPTGQKSTQFFPGTDDDAKLIFRSDWQRRRAIEKAGAEENTTPVVGAQVGAPSSNSTLVTGPTAH